MRGVLVVDKPGGVTSARVVAQVKRALGGVKVGHTGTLDPMATGVLPLCIGEATKIAGHLLADDKAYDGELVLGVSTDTLDTDGEVVDRRPEQAAAVGREALEAAVRALTGELEQVPPMYSALKKDGKRLHALARAGQVVEREPRSITVLRFELLSFDNPRVRFSVDCTKGTYVRSLVRDLGDALGCGACLSQLRRTRAGRFGLVDAVLLDGIDASSELISPAQALDHLPAVLLAPEVLDRVENGLQLRWEQVSDTEPPAALTRLLCPDGQLLALVRVQEDKLAFDRVFRRVQPGEIK